MSLIWNGEAEIIAAGYDCEAFRFRGSVDGWELSSAVAAKGRAGAGDQREESALNMFKQMDLKGKVKDDTQLKTIHQNTVTMIRRYEEEDGIVSKFSCKPPRLVSQFSLLTSYSEWSRRPHCHLDCVDVIRNEETAALKSTCSCLRHPL